MSDWIVAAIFIVLGVPTAIAYGMMMGHLIITPERARKIIEEREREEARTLQKHAVRLRREYWQRQDPYWQREAPAAKTCD